MKKLRVAVFGTGYWAQFQIAYWQYIGAEVVALWNRTYEKAEKTAAKFNIKRVCKTIDEVFEEVSFDIADIITDVEAHKELVEKAVHYKKPVICQKPMAYTLDDCRYMVNLCKENNIWYAVHENFRYQPQFLKVKQLLLKNIIGGLSHVHIQLRSPDRAIFVKQPALKTMEHMVLRDMGPHIFDVVRYLFGEISYIYTDEIISYPDIGVKDAACSVIETHNGLKISCDLLHEFNYKLFVEGEDGTLILRKDNIIEVKNSEGQFIYNPFDGLNIDLSLIPDDDRALHGEHVFAAIPACLKELSESYIKGIPAPTSGEDNLETIKVVFAAINSDINKKRIYINEI